MNPRLVSILTISTLLALSACKKADNDTASSSTKLATQEEPQDPNAITSIIPAETFKVTFTLTDDEPTLVENNSRILYKVKVTNESDIPVYGKGSKGVKLGLQVLGDDGTAQGNGAVRDFSRVLLPLIAPGESVVLDVRVPADGRLAGRKVRMALLQEGVRWYEDRGVIDLGPFQAEKGAFTGLPVGE